MCASLNYAIIGCLAAPSHYLNQWWLIVNWTFGNNFQWNMYQNVWIVFKRRNISITETWDNSVHVSQLSSKGFCATRYSPKTHGQRTLHEIPLAYYAELCFPIILKFCKALDNIIAVLCATPQTIDKLEWMVWMNATWILSEFRRNIMNRNS